MSDDIYVKIQNYIDTHKKVLWNYPFVFFNREHLIFGKEYLKIKYNLDEDEIKIKKEKDIETDSYHFPYYCGEFPDMVLEHEENKIKSNQEFIKAGYCSTLCDCNYRHLN